MGDREAQCIGATEEEGEVCPSDSEFSEIHVAATSRGNQGSGHVGKKSKRKSRYDVLDDKWSSKFATVHTEMSGLNSKLDSILNAISSRAQSPEVENDCPTKSRKQSDTLAFVTSHAHSKDSEVDDDEVLSVMAKGSFSDSESEFECAQNKSEAPHLSAETKKCLFDIFGDDATVKKPVKKQGIILDASQKEVLDSTLHCSTPSYLTAFSEENFELFPVDESTEQFLQVPSIDPLIEGCLVKRHGAKASFPKNKVKSLHTQPSKMVEKIAYKGQQAARLGIVMQLYVQQSLGNLIEDLQRDTIDKQKCVSAVKDIFAMSTKGLDQLGRTAALHHVVRRTVSMTDSGLYELDDASDFTSLPLTTEGVFGSGLETLLKSRKEKKKQLDELVPDLKKRDLKRKFPVAQQSETPKKRYFDRQAPAAATCTSGDMYNANSFIIPSVPRGGHQQMDQRGRGYARGRSAFPVRGRGRGGRFGRH